VTQERKLLQLIKQQINVEGEHVNSINELRKKVGNAAARLLLLEMRLDSEKHVAVLTEMLEILSRVHPETFLWDHVCEEYVDETLVKREFEEHVKKENSVIAQLKDEVKHTKDEGLKLLFQNLEEDETKHKRLLETMVRNLYRID
jgi:rubrerythrin